MVSVFQLRQLYCIQVNNPYLELKTTPWSGLAELGWRRLQSKPHGDMPDWLGAIENMPGDEGYCDLNLNAPILGRTVEDLPALREQLAALHPWRKGPLVLGGVEIDTEWRSDWKWDRLQAHLDLKDRQVLDIGCGNGYFGLRMLGAGARLVIGVDPTMVFVMQWLAMQKLCPGLNNFVLPLGIEDLPLNTGGFDCVFSMGVLYHRRNPVEHLEKLKKLTLPGGQIVLETLIINAEGRRTLTPSGRYARMRNVHAIPTTDSLLDWLRQAGLNDTRVLDINKTSIEEQRSTDWMRFESLIDCLDAGDRALTVEGHPAPVRVAILIQL